MPRKSSKRSSSRPAYRKKKQQNESFLGGLLIGTWNLFISFLKLYIPGSPEHEEPKKKKGKKRGRRYVATKRV